MRDCGLREITKMAEIGKLPKYNEKWTLRRKVRWILNIKVDRALPLPRYLNVIQEALKHINIYELSLARYKKLKISSMVETSDFYFRFFPLSEDTPVFDFLILNIDLAATYLEQLTIVQSGPKPSLRSQISPRDLKAATANLSVFSTTVFLWLNVRPTREKKLEKQNVF